MPKLIIDNLAIEVPEGTKVIAAAESLGIHIPRFCYHPALGSVGACRVCAVKILEGPVTGVQMSCMIDAADGMKVSTTDAEAVDFRKSVIEWLMINHPHDCPVCDEGGHCLLQDLTVAGGHGLRRFEGPKRTYTDQYLGPLVQHEMNRCIQCYRCVRYYREYAGYGDLGVTGIAGRVYFGRLSDGVLESPFSGNLIDICPTGVYTDRPSRYTGRRWDFERTPGVCIHCSLGCRTTVSARFRQVVRMEGRFSKLINGEFICDRGRYGFYYADRPGRPRAGRIQGQSVTADQAVQEARKTLERIAGQYGPDSVGVFGSGRNSLQTQAALADLCRSAGWQGPVFHNSRISGAAAAAAVSALTPENAVCLSGIQNADAILAVGADPVNEAPMLALAMRQAQRAGAAITAVDPRPLAWPFDFTHIPTGPEQMSEKIDAAARQLSGARRPVVICGTEITDAQIVAKAARIVADLQQTGQTAGLFCIQPRANTYGAVLLDERGSCAADLLAGIEAGRIRALVTFESDLWQNFPDRPRLEAALEKLELLVTVDFLDTPLFEKADIFVPSLTVFEAGGIYVNQEGRAQQADPAHAGGLPIARTGGGDHPPRRFEPGAPGRDMPAAWQAAFRLAGKPVPENDRRMTEWMVHSFPALAALLKMGEDGVRLFAGKPREPAAPVPGAGKGEDALEILPVASVFGDEPMASYSRCLSKLTGPPEVWIAQTDAEKLGLSDGDRIRISLHQNELICDVGVAENMAAGVLVIYRSPEIQWQQWSDGTRWHIHANQVKKLGGA